MGTTAGPRRRARPLPPLRRRAGAAALERRLAPSTVRYCLPQRRAMLNSGPQPPAPPPPLPPLHPPISRIFSSRSAFVCCFALCRDVPCVGRGPQRLVTRPRVVERREPRDGCVFSSRLPLSFSPALTRAPSPPSATPLQLSRATPAPSPPAPLCSGAGASSGAARMAAPRLARPPRARWATFLAVRRCAPARRCRRATA